MKRRRGAGPPRAGLEPHAKRRRRPVREPAHLARPGWEDATWESRPARKRGEIAVRDRPGAAPRTVRPGPALARRLRRLNWIAAAAFTLGGSLFALGAFVAEAGSGSATAAASIYCAGGLFFTTGAYASLLGAINGPREIGEDGVPTAPAWRWWSYEPSRIDWVATFALFVGTLAFGISLVDAFIDGLGTHGVNRLIWRPEVTGCVLFLISGHLAMAEVCHSGRPCLRRRDLAWSIVAINQIGSILFMIAALAAFTRPETSNEINVAIANWGTFAGAACFAIGGILQFLERPE